MPEKKNTYLTLHKNFVRTDIEYADRVTGESRTFNSVTLPKGTVIDGVDVSYYQFSPIPLSLMALDDTRQIGIGYLKNFTAVCLAGLIILILLIAFPLILGGLTGASTSTGTPIDGIATGLTYALQYLAMCVLLILSLVKSGAWARDIVSGI